MARGGTGVIQVRAASEVNQLAAFLCAGGVSGGRSAVAEQQAVLAMVNSSEPVISLLQHLASTSTWPPRPPGLRERRGDSERAEDRRARCLR